MNYFSNTEYLSNSDLKRYYKLAGYSFEEPANLNRIFEFGTLFHNIVLEPLKADVNDVDYVLAKDMASRFYRDPVCTAIMNMRDLKVEHEYYRNDIFGYKGRCKCDGKSKMLNMVLELKSLNVATQREFEESVDRFDYDQGASWYIHGSHLDRVLIVAVSKKNTNELFKKLIVRGDVLYHRGVDKIMQKKSVIDQIVGDNVTLYDTSLL